MNDQEIIAIVQAKLDGKEIEEQSYPEGKWTPFDGIWTFVDGYSYRIAPSKPLECWVNEYNEERSYHRTKEFALMSAKAYAIRTAVHLREVMQEDE